ncbi:MAG: DegT/DnrJ/EryC1/StrS family aminotransferase [Theionarchaea archaeon]|nr:DegT/DnrJ/EryC1/StrS family aminotransferase [Theionarchaea archaeon]
MSNTLAILGGTPVSKEKLPEELPYIGKEEEEALREVVRSRMISVFTSPKVHEFEQKFSDLVGVPHAVTVNSGTAAIHSALIAIGCKEGDEVIVPVYTYVASAIPMMIERCKVVFADVSPDTMNIDPENVESLITEKTKAIMPVHLFGNPADLDLLNEICYDNNIALIEDAAQAVGAHFGGDHVGSSNIGCFSFGETKMITCGEGGMVTCTSDELYNRLIAIRQEGETIGNYATTDPAMSSLTAEDVIHGIDYHIMGYNYRMTAFQAAVGSAQIDKLPKIVRMRRDNAKYLMNNLGSFDELKFQTVHPKAQSVYNRLVLRVASSIDRDGFLGALIAEGVPAGVWYPRLLTEGALMSQTFPDEARKSFPGASALCKSELVLPVYPGLTRAHLDLIIEAVEKVLDAFTSDPAIAESVHEITMKRSLTRFFSSVYMEY